jgi:HK97 family phage major capsid protein
MKEILDAVTDLTKSLEANKAAVEKAMAESQKSLETQIEEAKSEFSHLKSELDEIKTAQGRMKDSLPTKGAGFGMAFQKAFDGMKDGIVAMAEGRSKNVGVAVGSDFMQKAVADMTIGTHVTGDAASTYQAGIVGIPYRQPHARALLPFIPSQYDSYKFWQHTEGEGAIDWQSAEGAAKSQFDEDVVEKDILLKYLAGYVIITRQMLRNIPGLQAYLNQWLPKKYMRAEDGKFYTFISTEAGLSTFAATGINIERLITTMGTIAGQGFAPNGICINPATWARIVLTKGATSGDYTLPPGITLSSTGDMTLFGTPIYQVPWVADDKAIVGDWTYGMLCQSEAMSVRISEEHGTILTQNKVLALIEASIGFGLQNPKAFAFGDLGDVA